MNRAEHIREAQWLADVAAVTIKSPGSSVHGSMYGMEYAAAAAQAAQAHAAIAALLPDECEVDGCDLSAEHSGGCAPWPFIGTCPNPDVVEATIYCGHDDCSLEDGHDGDHVPAADRLGHATPADTQSRFQSGGAS